MKRKIKYLFKFFQSSCIFIKFILIEVKKIKQAEIVFFFPYYHTGGAERVHADIIKALDNKKCTVIFTEGSATKSFYKQFNENASIIELNFILNKKNNYINKLLQKSIVTSINSSRCIQYVFCSNNSYYYKILPKINNSIKKIDLFHAFRENDSRIFDVIATASTVNKRIVINNKAKLDIIKFYNNYQIPAIEYNKIQIIQNGIDLSNLNFNIKNINNIKIGFVGRWSAEKRPLIFLEIAKEISKKIPSVQFFIAGTGMKSNLDKIKNSNVEFLGEISDNNTLSRLYEELHIIIMPSVYEGFPMVIMESMAHGVIPITTDVGGINEHIMNGENGILISDGNEEKIVFDFINAIELLIIDNKKMEIMSKNAFEYAQSHFSIEQFNINYRRLFNL